MNELPRKEKKKPRLRPDPLLLIRASPKALQQHPLMTDGDGAEESHFRARGRVRGSGCPAEFTKRLLLNGEGKSDSPHSKKYIQIIQDYTFPLQHELRIEKEKMAIEEKKSETNMHCRERKLVTITSIFDRQECCMGILPLN